MSRNANGPAKPWIYALPVSDKWLLFSPASWTAALVNPAAAEKVYRRLAGLETGLDGSLEDLCLGLTEGAIDLASASEGLEKLVIMPTRACNMRCVYCDFGADDAPSRQLDPATACRLVDHYAAQASARGRNTVRIHFFGGEPLCAMGCTETVVHYARALCARLNLVPWLELTTNGLFPQDWDAFVGDYFDSVIVSLDGDRSMHDFNRRGKDGSGTYDRIADNIRRLSGYSAELCLRMCVTDRSVSALADMTRQVCRDFDIDVLSLEMLSENETSRAAGLRRPDAFAFAAAVADAELAASAFGVRVVHGPSELEGPRMTSCPLGNGTLMLSPDGRLSGCYLDPERWQSQGLDLDLGKVSEGRGVCINDAAVKSIGRLLKDKPRCAACFGRFTCAGGCHVDQTPPGCATQYDARCHAIRVVTAIRLLRSLGCHGEAAALSASPPAMEALAFHGDDRLASWGGRHE